MQRCRVLAPMAPQIMANLPLQKHHRVDQRTSETNAFPFPGAFANGSRHLPRSDKGAEKEKLSEGQAVWVHTKKGTHFNHFLSTATSSCAIPPTLALHKRTKKKTKPLRNFSDTQVKKAGCTQPRSDAQHTKTDVDSTIRQTANRTKPRMSPAGMDLPRRTFVAERRAANSVGLGNFLPLT